MALEYLTLWDTNDVLKLTKLVQENSHNPLVTHKVAIYYVQHYIHNQEINGDDPYIKNGQLMHHVEKLESIYALSKANDFVGFD